MIKRILQLIIQNGILDKKEIARQAGIQVETLDDIIRLLLQRGYLRTEVNNCQKSDMCEGCHFSSDCESMTSSGQAYFITDKGKAYANLGGGAK
ncbi:MAG: hypothetical protein ACFFCP_10060 [Promethearchaeota archaeon]